MWKTKYTGCADKLTYWKVWKELYIRNGAVCAASAAAVFWGKRLNDYNCVRRARAH